MMSITRTLRMKFTTDLGKGATVSVGCCREDLTAVVVGEAMDVLIASEVFAAPLSGKTGADIVERSVTELF